MPRTASGSTSRSRRGPRRIYVAGHRGLLGSALVRRYSKRADVELVTAARGELDLADPAAVRSFFSRTSPDAVILAAGRVGGILANASSPAEFIYENLMMQTNVIHAAYKAGIRRLLHFGSSCMYPKVCAQPMRPGQLHQGPLEATSEPYAIAKLSGMAMCAAYSRQYKVHYTTAIPATIYGPGDSFDPDGAHLIPALIRKFHDAKARRERMVTLWGSGAARREFIYSDDLAEACDMLIERGDHPDPINIGTGEGHTVAEFAMRTAAAVGYSGAIRWDASQPDGAPVKLLNSAVIRKLGWDPKTPLKKGLRRTYEWFLAHHREPVQEGEVCVSS